MLDAQKRRNIAALAKQKKATQALSAKDQKLKAVAEIAFLETKKPVLNSSSKENERMLLQLLPTLSRTTKLPRTETFHPTLPLLLIL